MRINSKKRDVVSLVLGAVLAVAVVAVAVQAYVADAEESAEPFRDAVTIRLSIEGASSNLFDSEIEVTPCSDIEAASPLASGYCALNSLGLEVVWTQWGDMFFLESVEGEANDFASGISWNWFSDLEYGQTSLDEHFLSEGERLLVTLGRMPLKLTFSTTTPLVGSTTSVDVLEFGFDEFWNPSWKPAASTTVFAAGQIFETSESGSIELVSTSTDPILLSASKDGFISSSGMLYPYVALAEVDDQPAEVEPTNPPQSGSSGGGSGSYAPLFDTRSAISFLLSNQRQDGSFGADLYTDWAALALAATVESEAKERLRAYLVSTELSSDIVTDYERRAMALMALGIDPRTGTSIDYIARIMNSFDGTQIGERDLINDDIFAIFVLVKSGLSASHEIVAKTGRNIVLNQRADGSWEGSPDLTAAAVQALVLLKSVDEAVEAKGRARDYLASIPRVDGGYGNPYSTSWIMQAAIALGEDISGWGNGAGDPRLYMARSQGTDGGVGELSAGATSRLWATAYAIPAILGKTWADLLASFAIVESAVEVGATALAAQEPQTAALPVGGIENAADEILVILDTEWLRNEGSAAELSDGGPQAIERLPREEVSGVIAAVGAVADDLQERDLAFALIVSSLGAIAAFGVTRFILL